MLKDIKNWIMAGLVILLLMIGAKGIIDNRSAKDQITQLQLDKQELTITVNQKGQIITQQDVIITDDQTALKSLSDSFFALKKADDKKIKNVIAFYKGITKTKIDTVALAYVDTLATHKFEDSVAKQCAQVIDYYERNYVSVPRTAEDSTADFNVKVDIRRDSARFSIQIPDSQYIRFATLKGGLFKKDIFGKRHFILKKQIVAQVLHTNKKIEILGQNSALYVPPPKPQLLLRGLILVGGFILGSQM